MCSCFTLHVTVREFVGIVIHVSRTIFASVVQLVILLMDTSLPTTWDGKNVVIYGILHYFAIFYHNWCRCLPKKRPNLLDDPFGNHRNYQVSWFQGKLLKNSSGWFVHVLA